MQVLLWLVDIIAIATSYQSKKWIEADISAWRRARRQDFTGHEEVEETAGAEALSGSGEIAALKRCATQNPGSGAFKLHHYQNPESLDATHNPESLDGTQHPESRNATQDTESLNATHNSESVDGDFLS